MKRYLVGTRDMDPRPSSNYGWCCRHGEVWIWEDTFNNNMTAMCSHGSGDPLFIFIGIYLQLYANNPHSCSTIIVCDMTAETPCLNKKGFFYVKLQPIL